MAASSSFKTVSFEPDLVGQFTGGRKLARWCAGDALAVHYEGIGGTVRWHGKPYRSVYDSSMALLGIADRARVLAVGDSLRTDIARSWRRGSTVR